jgi:hypothetical protein
MSFALYPQDRVIFASMKKVEGVRYYLDMSSFTQEQNIGGQLKTRLQVIIYS